MATKRCQTTSNRQNEIQNNHKEMKNKQKRTTIRQNDPQGILNNCREMRNKGDAKRL